MPNRIKGAAAVGKQVAGVKARPPRPTRPPRPSRPYTRQLDVPRNVGDIDVSALRHLFNPPTTHTPTVTGTGVTTTSGGGMPGASDPYGGDIKALMRPPKVKNWNKLTPGQYAQAMLAPQYASVYASQHQQQLMDQEQQAAITGYGADLAKIMKDSGGTLGPEYAAALSMSALRNFAYQKYMTSQKYADEYAKIAATYPTYATQYAAQLADQKLKQDAFNLQKVVAAQAYHLNVAKTAAYNQATGARLNQAQQNINISKGNLKLAAARYGLSVQQYKLQANKAAISWKQWNKEQANKANTVNVSLSKAYGYPVNNQGVRIPGAPKIPGGPSGAGGGGGKVIDRTASKELGYWVYKDLSRVKLTSSRRLGLPDKPPGRYKPNAGPQNAGRRGLTQAQYRSAYADAVAGVQAATEAGATYQQYVEKAIANAVPRWVAAKAWKKYHRGG